MVVLGFGLWILSAPKARALNRGEGALSTPVALATQVNDQTGDVSVTWNASAGNDVRYDLEEQKGLGGKFSIVHSGAGLEYHTPNREDATYWYRLRACNGTGCTGFTPLARAEVVKVPSAPGPIQVPSRSTMGQYLVTWGPSGETVSYYSLQEGKSGSWRGLAITAKLEFELANHEDGIFSYRVSACNRSGCSAYVESNPIEVLKVPAVPASLSSDSVSSTGRYLIQWAPGPNGTVHSYELERKVENTWLNIYQGDALSYPEHQPQDGAYFYRLRACNASGCSGYTAEASTTVAIRFPELIPDAKREPLPVPAQENVGAVKGEAGVSGGSIMDPVFRTTT